MSRLEHLLPRVEPAPSAFAGGPAGPACNPSATARDELVARRLLLAAVVGELFVVIWLDLDVRIVSTPATKRVDAHARSSRSRTRWFRADAALPTRASGEQAGSFKPTGGVPPVGDELTY